jgi:glycyl-tRNA synthetase
MENQIDKFQQVISHAKEYGFVFPSSELYDGLSAVYDYGQYGVELRRNIRDYWWKSMVQMHDNIVGLDSAIFMHPTIWKASGHVDNFSDPMVDNKDSKKRYRVDVLLEDKAAQLEAAGDKAAAEALIQQMDALLTAADFKGLNDLLVTYKIICPVSETANWTDVRQFNLMFSTQMGSVSEESDTIYLRPETAQGIFVNFLNVQKTGRMKIPFGIAQTGKAFRNEIVARQFIFRMREFEQMEMQFFVRPGTEMEWYNHWKTARLAWHKSLGIDASNLRYHDHTKLAHYANAAVDIEYNFPFGFKEVEGIHSRTDFDLKQHQTFSRKKIQYFDNDLNELGKPYGNYTPYVVETSIGLDRIFLAILCNALEEQQIPKEDGTMDSRSVLHLPAMLAPYKIAILPLVKKDGLPEAARKIADDLRMYHTVYYEEKDTIGKRYRRMDAIGTPFCVCVDYDTLKDNTVTVRDRDAMTQTRVSIDSLKQLIDEAVRLK